MPCIRLHDLGPFHRGLHGSAAAGWISDLRAARSSGHSFGNRKGIGARGAKKCGAQGYVGVQGLTGFADHEAIILRSAVGLSLRSDIKLTPAGALPWTPQA